eukprot:TRINITY_DN597_c0_g1_i1.p1 TRINITY_DN597_c0_g1~~TRINITY_DN597_c0_g1_i1.p1  ORF type:complete len:117 (+),score=46.24 TRINITY_DN597_c0_g1_i1:101-451(+)
MSSEKVVVSINGEEEFDELLKENELLVVDFYTTWCGPCKVIAPKLERLAKKYVGVIKFAKADLEFVDHKETQGVSTMPTFKFYNKGNLFHTVQGADLEAVVAAVEALKASQVERDL